MSELEERLRLQHEIGIFSASLIEGHVMASYGEAATVLERYRVALERISGFPDLRGKRSQDARDVISVARQALQQGSDDHG